MSLELLRKILDKADREISNYSVGFFNWTEPLLHPELPSMCKEVHSRGKYLALSSNLNIKRNYSEIVPYVNEWCISLSGFSQDTYGKTHKGGDVEKVKSNMAALAEAKRHTRSQCMVYTRYIRYRENIKDEKLMKEFTESLGFTHGSCWAQFMPLEKLTSYLDGHKNLLSKEDLEIIDNLAIDPIEYITLAQKYDAGYCHLRSDQITLDADGNSILCCSVYDQNANNLGNFLSLNLLEMQEKRLNHATCQSCMRLGAHLLSIPNKDLSERVNEKAEKKLNLSH